MFPKLFAIFLSAMIVSGSNMTAIQRPEVPENIKAPDGEKIVLQAHATGFQIYGCQAGPDGKLAWTLKRPEAQLFDQQGNKIGVHGEGPFWKHNDGSEVTGKVAARADSPAGSIPWLLLNAVNHSGSGVLSRVTTIQRIHTEGGKPPIAADCNSSQANSEVRVKYSADYYFYAPEK
jgi:hypothetical protein